MPSGRALERPADELQPIPSLGGCDEVDGDVESHEEFHRAPMTPWAGTAERERIGQVGAFAGGAGFDQVGGSPPADERAGPADDDDDDEVDGDAGSHEEFHRAHDIWSKVVVFWVLGW